MEPSFAVAEGAMNRQGVGFWGVQFLAITCQRGLGITLPAVGIDHAVGLDVAGEKLVEVDGQEVELTFLTNHLDWAAASMAALYQCRWQSEVFFQQIKPTLQLADFPGKSARAVLWLRLDLRALLKS